MANAVPQTATHSQQFQQLIFVKQEQQLQFLALVLGVGLAKERMVELPPTATLAKLLLLMENVDALMDKPLTSLH
jgi:hypothetical protein